jgi:hypothetical protein
MSPFAAKKRSTELKVAVYVTSSVTFAQALPLRDSVAPLIEGIAAPPEYRLVDALPDADVGRGGACRAHGTGFKTVLVYP